MSKFGIYSAAGVKKAEGYPTFTGTYMKAGVLDFREIASPVPIDWAVGDYVGYELNGSVVPAYSRTGFKYVLYNIPQVKRQASNGTYGGAFVYRDVQFFDDSHQADICPFRDLVPGDNRIHFSTQPQISVFDNVAGIAERLQACLEDMYGSGSWVVRTATAQDGASQELLDLMADEREFVVSGVSITGALEKVYEIWPEVGFVYTIESGVNTLIIGGAGLNANEDTYKYGKGYGLTSIAKTVANADDMANRLYVYGSSKNMLSRWYSQFDIKDADSVDIQHLMLPISVWGTTDDKPDPAKAFIETPSAASNLRPKTVYFDGTQDLKEIYPTIRETTIQALWDAMPQGSDFRPDTSVWTGTERIDTLLSAQASFDSGLAADNGKSAVQNLSWDAVVSSSASHIVRPNFSVPLFARDFALSEAGSLNFEIVLNANGTVSFPGTEKVMLRARIHRGYSDSTPTFIDQSVELEKDASGNFIIAPASFSASRVQFASTGGVLVSFSLEFSVSSSQSSDTLAIDMDGSLTAAVSRYRAKTFNVTLRQIGFDISAQANLGDGKTMVMRSGKCVGRSFKVSSTSYNSTTDTWEVELIRSNDESLSQWFPNNDYPVEADDEFVLTEIAMPGIYISLAENRLLAAAQELLADTSKEQWQYTPDIDAKFMIESGRTILPAVNVTLEDEIVPGGSVSMLVDSVTINEGDAAIPTYKLTLRDKKRKSYSDTASVQEPSSTPVSTVQQTVTPAQRTVINDSFFEEDGNGNVKLKDEFGGLWAKGFMTAGGCSSSGGGGEGGLTPSGMWQLLGADTTEPISAYHIPIGTGLGIDSQGNIVVTSPGSVVGIKIGATTYSPSSGIVDITAGIPDIGPLSEAVMSLQSQIDSVAARDCFDELTVTTLFSDVLAASDAYLDTLSLGGSDLAAWLGTLVPKTTTVNGKALTGNITLDKGDVGLGNVTNLAASAYFTEFDNGSGEHANKVVATIGGTTKRLTVGYATKALGDKNGNDIYATYVSGVSVGSGAQKDNLLIAKNGSNSAITVPYATISQKTRFTPAYSGASEIEPFLDWFVPEEYATGKFRLRLNPKYDGMYADGFVIAGGPGSGGGGGGGGGLSPLGMWQLLTNDSTITSYGDNTKIAVEHIPGLPWSILTSGVPTTISGYGITDAYTKTQVDNLIGAINQFHYEVYPSTSSVTDPQSNVLYLIGPTGSGSDKYEEYVYPNATTGWTKIGDTTIDLSAYLTITSAQATYQPIISDLSTIRTQAGHGETAYNSLDTISDCLQSLQSQIDSVATKDMFDELKASAFYADMAAVSSLGVDSIELAGSTISAWGNLFSSLTSSGTTITAVIGGQSRTHTISASDLIGTIANNPVNRATADANGNIIASTYRTIDSLKSKGSVTLPVYFDSNGNAQTITSYEGNAASASRLQGTATYAIWGQTYWQNGVPQSVTAAPNLYIGGSKVLASAATQALLGITSISAAVSPGAQDETRIEWDSEHHAWHFYGGIYADSFVSAGGLNEDSGGGGGITPEGLWEILGDDSTNDKIASTHIKIGSGLAIDGLGNIYVTSPGIITTVAGVAPVNGDIPVASLKTALGLKALAYKDSLVASDIPNLSWNKITSDKPNSLSGYGITNAYTKGEVDGMISALNVSEISEAVMSLQSQVDSVAARDMFDELKASVLFADMASVADLYPETIHLGSKSLTSSSTVVTINGTAVALAGSFNTASVTAGTAGTSSATSGYTLAVPYVTYNQYGIITGAGTHTHTINNIPNSSLANSTIKINGTTTALGGSINVGTVTSVATGTGLTGGTITGSGTISINSTYLGYIDNGNTAYGWGTTISNALQSLQSQIDSVAARSEFDNLTATVGYFDMLSVGESVGIGGTLGVTGATTLNGTTINGATYIYNTLQVGTSATARDSIFYGKIYIGAATPYINYANSALHTNVGFYSDSFITAGATASSSDARLKDDIHSVTPERAISLLSSLHGCEWTWNNKKDYLAGKHGSGLIAQEVEKVMPWAVLDLNGEYSLNYNTLWGIAIPVMQDHENRIRKLEGEVQRLSEENDRLRSQLTN